MITEEQQHNWKMVQLCAAIIQRAMMEEPKNWERILVLHREWQRTWGERLPEMATICCLPGLFVAEQDWQHK